MRHHSEQELERFKTEIDLVSFLGAQGYEIDRDRSTDQHASMRHETGARAVVTRDSDHHWMYFNPLDAGDNGTIIDWVKRHVDANLGHVRKILRRALGEPPEPPEAYTKTVKRSARDARLGLAEWERSEPAETHSFLDARHIPGDIQFHPRFRDTWRVCEFQGHSNIAFPYSPDGKTTGVGGVEQRYMNPNGSSGRYFTKNGSKGCWLSRCQHNDTQTVVVESPVDALSYAAMLDPDELDQTAFIATGGQLSEANADAIISEIQARGHAAILALDNDEAGHSMRDRLMTKLDAAHLQHSVQESRTKDWNSDLEEHEQTRGQARGHDPDGLEPGLK